MTWALTDLFQAGLLSRPQRGFYVITPEGRKLLATNPSQLTRKDLLQYPSFEQFLHPSKDTSSKKGETQEPVDLDEKTPDEQIQYAYDLLHVHLANQLLERVKSCSPAFFENLVVELLLKMGYGNFRKEAGKVTGRSGDGGIDGIIEEDKLGLDLIYIQAKRYGAPVNIDEVRAFAGVLAMQNNARKGVFITTSRFSDKAYEETQRGDRRIVLIDGKQLANLMIEYNIGVTPRKIYEIKRIDSDYFEVPEE